LKHFIQRNTIAYRPSIKPSYLGLGECGVSLGLSKAGLGSKARRGKGDHVESSTTRPQQWATECRNVDAASAGWARGATTGSEYDAAEFKPNCKIIFFLNHALGVLR
jgi:hypothetical protein